LFSLERDAEVVAALSPTAGSLLSETEAPQLMQILAVAFNAAPQLEHCIRTFQ
jgi:hypothetical protein